MRSEGRQAAMNAYTVELLGILIALGLLIFVAFRGLTPLLAAPAAAIVTAAFSGEPILAKWTLTLMGDGGASLSISSHCFWLAGSLAS